MSEPTRLEDLRVEIPRSIVDAVNDQTLTRRATAADLVEALKAEGFIVIRSIDYEAAAWALHPGVEPKGWSLTEQDRKTARRIVDAALVSVQEATK